MLYLLLVASLTAPDVFLISVDTLRADHLGCYGYDLETSPNIDRLAKRSLLYEGLKHYFIIRFPQRAGALKQFVNNVLGPDDDIAYFEYSKKTSREKGPAVVGIEIGSKDEFVPLISRMEHNGFVYEYLNDKPTLFQFLI